MRDDLIYSDPSEIIPLAPGKHGHRDLCKLGSSHDENHMGGRLFEGLQECIEGTPREHVDLIDDKRLEPCNAWGIPGVFDKVSDIVNPGMGSGIYLEDIDSPRCSNVFTQGACIAGGAG